VSVRDLVREPAVSYLEITCNTYGSGPGRDLLLKLRQIIDAHGELPIEERCKQSFAYATGTESLEPNQNA
jgi:hypothetical protein